MYEFYFSTSEKSAIKIGIALESERPLISKILLTAVSLDASAAKQKRLSVGNAATPPFLKISTILSIELLTHKALWHRLFGLSCKLTKV